MKPTEANARPRKKPILILTVGGLDRDQRYRGALTLDITAMDEKTGMSSLIVQVDDALPIPLHFVEGESTSWALQTALFADGLHTVSVTAMDRSLHKNQTQHTLPFYSDNTPPALHVPPETR